MSTSIKKSCVGKFTISASHSKQGYTDKKSHIEIRQFPIWAKVEHNLTQWESKLSNCHNVLFCAITSESEFGCVFFNISTVHLSIREIDLPTQGVQARQCKSCTTYCTVRTTYRGGKWCTRSVACSHTSPCSRKAEIIISFGKYLLYMHAKL